jgi:hypothetical protein
MNIPNEPGRYIGVPKKWGVNETGQNSIPTFACEFDLLQVWNGVEWVDISQEGFEITSWFYLFKKDGQPNEFTIKALKESMGWDGTSMAALNDTEWGQTEVQLTLDIETYEGKQKMKVQFINPRDSVPGGVQKADPQTVQSLDQKYGATLRALSGTNGKSKATTTAPKSTPAASKPAAASDGKSEAWKTFQRVWGEYVKERPEEASLRDTKWREAFNEFFQGADPKTLTQDQWQKFSAYLPTYDFMGIPF